MSSTRFDLILIIVFMNDNPKFDRFEDLLEKLRQEIRTQISRADRNNSKERVRATQRSRIIFSSLHR